MGLLETKIEPDVEKLLAIIRRTALPKRVHHIELFLDNEIKQQVCKRFGLQVNSDNAFSDLQREIKLHSFLGYDVFRIPLAVKAVFSFEWLNAEDTTVIAEQSRKVRQWSDEHSGPIQSWQDFEKYQWPKVSNIDFGPLEWLNKNLPENMGCFDLTGHILEVASMLMGYESLCLKLYDEPDLVDAVFENVGKFYIQYTDALCDFDCIKFAWGSDDMGFRTSTLMSAKILREKVLCWHKKCAQAAHKKGRPYILHSCGNVEEIMEDLIEYVEIDGKHSFEDAIMPVTEVKKKYGSRISILGGIDVDFLCRADEKAIRRQVRETLEVCMADGGYCLGTGNTVTNYIPLDNYLVMLDEGRKFAP